MHTSANHSIMYNSVYEPEVSYVVSCYRDMATDTIRLLLNWRP